ncbi:GNAT family N-acetyltransferase [Agaribacter marinus]|uniref:GNAT family N-acetyltransferase n=1 Tax=Virgibacillus salarius TaxID=447199 RepID=A0A941DZQ6_9BACI|nr:GNAT family N-acetyltransferase [Virgibacillus salarius]MBR7796313.1 GNAT family N-acetyltransferase [Virgibacillus salarius]NAZ09021.1 GNAT family N-acetyltransferase [Agaribacter marinus]
MNHKIIAEGKLPKSKQSFYVRFLTVDDIPQILELQQIVEQAMEVPTALQSLSYEEYRHILTGNGSMIGIFITNKMIAFRAMLIPNIDEHEHLGIDAGLSKEERLKMIYSEISNVHPDFRGNRLQTYMGELLFTEVDKERFQYVATTVAPFNIPSIKDKIALGMEIIALKKKYNGKLRYILLRDFTREFNTTIKKKIVRMMDYETQKKLLEEGYRGVSIQIDNDTYVHYKKN